MLENVGETGISNLGGNIVGYWGDGINILSNHNYYSEGEGYFGLDRVGIYNGGSQYIDAPVASRYGYIIGGDTAVNITAYYSAWVLNAGNGAIIGDGQQNESDVQPVLNLSTIVSVPVPEGDYPVDSSGIFVVNDGVMTSKTNPDFTRSWDPLAVNELPTFNFNWQQLHDDTTAIMKFATSGGTHGDWSPLPDYAQTASDYLLHSEGGPGLLVNGGGFASQIGSSVVESTISDPLTTQATMFGRVQMYGSGPGYVPSEGGYIPEPYIGDVVMNFGQWYTTNSTPGEGGLNGWEYGNILAGEALNVFWNGGFIQTAFGKGAEYTSFATFGSNGIFDNSGNPSDGIQGVQLFGDLLSGATSGAGWLSMVDNEANDETYIYANFYGADPGQSNFKSYLAVDTNFATQKSDILEIGTMTEGGSHDIGGSTGVVVNATGTSPASTHVGDWIPVVSADGSDLNDPSNQCFYQWCKPGDTVFLSKLTPGSFKIGQAYFVPSGAFIWGIQESEGSIPSDPLFSFVADFGPDAAQQAAVTTGAQNVFYDTGGVVYDHEYGNNYPQGGQGGGGADLPYASPDQTVAPPPAGHRSALWGRISGTWLTQDSTFKSGGLPFDTSFDQHDYGLLAGIEMRPPNDNSGWRLGLYGGWLNSDQTFSSYGASTKYNGGTVGGYAAYINGPLHADAEVKADFLGVDYTSPSMSASTTATSVGVLTNIALRQQKGNFYYEPIVSFDYVNTALGDASGGGAKFSYSNGESIRAGVGGRIGTTLGTPGGKKIDLDVMAKLWDEFGSANAVTVSDGLNTETFTDSISGLFGEVSGRATIYSADRMWSGFGEVNGKFSTNVTSVTGKLGVRRNF